MSWDPNPSNGNRNDVVQVHAGRGAFRRTPADRESAEAQCHEMTGERRDGGAPGDLPGQLERGFHGVRAGRPVNCTL